MLRRAGESKTRRLHPAFAAHLRQVAARYLAERYARAVLIIDNAPWHASESVRTARPSTRTWS